MAKVFLGTELKLNINVEPIGNIHIGDDNVDFEILAYCSSKRTLLVKKEDAIPGDDENNYVILIDTLQVGMGDLKCKVTVKIPDMDFDDRYRTEVVVVDTGITIIKDI